MTTEKKTWSVGSRALLEILGEDGMPGIVEGTIEKVTLDASLTPVYDLAISWPDGSEERVLQVPASRLFETTRALGAARRGVSSLPHLVPPLPHGERRAVILERTPLGAMTVHPGLYHPEQEVRDAMIAMARARPSSTFQALHALTGPWPLVVCVAADRARSEGAGS